MASRKCWSLLECLSAEERQAFPHWLRGERLGKECIEERMARFWLSGLHDDEAAFEQRLWKELYGDEAYNDARFRNRCSDLARELMEFVAIREFRQEEGERWIWFAKGMLARDNSKNYLKWHDMAMREIEHIPYRDINYERLVKEMELTALSYRAANRIIETPESYERFTKAFHRFWFSEKMKELFITTELKNLIKIDTTFFSEVTDMISRYDYLMECPSIRIELDLFRLKYEVTQIEEIEEISAYIESNLNLFRPVEAANIYLVYFNFFAWRTVETSDLYYIRKTPGLILKGIENGYILDGNGTLLHLAVYRFLVHTLAILGQIEQAWECLEKYRYLLPKGEATNSIYLLSKAYCHMHAGELEMAKKVLNQQTLSLPTYTDQILASTINLEIGIIEDEELQDTAMHLTRAENILRFLKRHRKTIPETRYNFNRNMYQHLLAILKVRSAGDLQSLIEQIDHIRPMLWPERLKYLANLRLSRLQQQAADNAGAKTRNARSSSRPKAVKG